jgi:hypothetical protein
MRGGWYAQQYEIGLYNMYSTGIPGNINSEALAQEMLRLEHLPKPYVA